MSSDFLDRERRDEWPRGIVGVIGYRSWIARHLIELLRSQGYAVGEFEKLDILEHRADLSHLDCLYVFPGRSRPTEDEMEQERELIWQMTSMSRQMQPRRIVVIGSTADERTPYGSHKRWVEGTLLSAWEHMCQTFVIRAPAVFGPGQPEDVDMLIPRLSRTRGAVELTAPNYVSQFIYVGDLVTHMARFADQTYWDLDRCGMPSSMCLIPGTFYITPQQLKDLYNTWESYRWSTLT